MENNTWLLAISTCLYFNQACIATSPSVEIDTSVREAAIRTPISPLKPRINGPKVFGARLGRPFLFQIPVSGERPFKFGVSGLPAGLALDPTSGRITGTSPDLAATHLVTVSASNKHGSVNSDLVIVIGETLALTLDEMHTQMTQWCIFAVPLLIGTDLTKMDTLVVRALTNDEVIAVNQDRLGKQGWMLRQDGDRDIWVKPLSGDRWAVALFNRGDQAANMQFDPAELKISGPVIVRD